ncbi:hypothetical protein H6P81_004709 [Aristolochia fimbriata]|uniref:Uncharacterized protein n=1 Tax=Aristolochia fimbriata TaxID=158543 RepID=A0AAV7ESF8_ARIFI|nr:hypothetical protein H6P81_004709 [Aristolochia fimbriata]
MPLSRSLRSHVSVQITPDRVTFKFSPDKWPPGSPTAEGSKAPPLDPVQSLSGQNSVRSRKKEQSTRRMFGSASNRDVGRHVWHTMLGVGGGLRRCFFGILTGDSTPFRAE